MNLLLKLEEAGMFLLCIFFFSQLDFAWWWFPALLLIPDIGMVGYLISPRIGALTYNLFHHRLIASLLAIYSVYTGNANLNLVAIILFAHISLDRMLGYGLKYSDRFHHTHLGTIG